MAAAATLAVLALNGAAASSALSQVSDETVHTWLRGAGRSEQWGTESGSAAVTASSHCGEPATPSSAVWERAAVLGRTLFFTADDGPHGRELWRSDGKKAGTVLVKDINPAVASSYPRLKTSVGGTLFFTADDGIHGGELWKTDGTRAGTALVKDIDPRHSSGPSDLTRVEGGLLFTADDGTHGRELWRSDGTRAGTVLIQDINPGPGGYGPRALTRAGGSLFFVTDDGSHGDQLWKTDGTRAGTVVVMDLWPEGGDNRIDRLAGVGRRLFFTADDGAHGWGLWKSDGTAAGTVLVKVINPDPEYDFGPRLLTGVSGTLFFAAEDGAHGWELWKSDGTEAGTVLVKDIRPGGSYYPERYSVPGPNSLTALGGTLFFTAVDGTHGRELWRSDGTEAGTVLVKDINPGPNPHFGPYSLTGERGTLFFTAKDESHGYELWKSDGTRTGTVLVKDINPDAGGYGAWPLAGLRGRLFFNADDGTHGWELWKSDGTAAGTVLVNDINRGGRFRVGRLARPDTRAGTVSVRVTPEGAGTLVVGPASGSLLRTSRAHLRAAGPVRIVLRPTARGMRKLEHALHHAHRQGRKVGKLPVTARFTFTPCGGTSSRQVHQYTLRLR